MSFYFGSEYNLKNSWENYNSENCPLHEINVPKRKESLETAMSWDVTTFKLA
jgi:hypothetical protein